MAKGFFENLGGSFKFFKENFKTILILTIILSIIPSLILTFIGLPMLDTSDQLSFYESNQGILYLILGVVFGIIGVLLSTSIMVMSFSAKKIDYKTALSSASKYWISYILLGLTIMASIIILFIPSIISFYFAFPLSNVPLILLGLVLLILPIYFIIKIILSPIVLIGENKNVIASIKRSFELTRGKFWRTLLYLFLLAIVLMLISMITGIIGGLINTLTGNITILTDATTGIQTAHLTATGLFIQQIFSLVASLITLPISLFFLKDYYSDIKENKK